MEIFFDNEYMSILEYEDGILELLFKKETENLTDDGFKRCALKWVEILKEKKNKRLLVDVQEFNYQLKPEVVEWRNQNVVQAYNDLNVEKFAFITPKTIVKQDNPKNTFVTKDFQDRQDAKAWLLS